MKSDTAFDGDLNGGQLDAFRHAYWMAGITRQFGWKVALSLGKAHEKGNYRDYQKKRMEEGSVPDEQDCTMDYLNNDAGIEIGQTYKYLDNNSIIEKVKEFLLSGKLFVLMKDMNGNYLKCNGEIIRPEELKGRWKTEKCIVPSDYGK